MSEMVVRYDLQTLGSVLGAQLPVLLRSAPAFLGGFVGEERLAADTRVAVQLRLAKRYGCPVCRALFPPIARRVGFDETAIHSALEGAGEGLPPQAAAALLWVDALIDDHLVASPSHGDGDDTLSEGQREHLRFMLGLEAVVHSVGLMFLPHALIERAARS